jgi:death-on-curing protein
VLAVYAASIGVPRLRSHDGLASAVGRPQQTIFGEDAYPTLSKKAAALMQSLAQNQPFVDGNKRIAWICGKLFLQLHGLTLRATETEGLDLFANQIATGMSIDELTAWIENHLYPF